jgi:hypothetical protein
MPREGRRLLEISHAKVAPEDDRARLGLFPACNDIEQGRLAHAVLGNQAYALALGEPEADVVKQHLVADGKRQVIYLKKGINKSHNVEFAAKLRKKVENPLTIFEK